MNERIKYSVIQWNAENVYLKENTVKWYALEKAAQKYADKMNSQDSRLNLVVRQSNYMR